MLVAARPRFRQGIFATIALQLPALRFVPKSLLFEVTLLAALPKHEAAELSVFTHGMNMLLWCVLTIDTTSKSFILLLTFRQG
jgi:hypothetical protein